MNLNQMLPVCFVLCLGFIAGFTPSFAHGAVGEVALEKEMELTMRRIGHEVLMCVGDETSRVLPIEKLSDEQYRIPFESEMGFYPEEIAAIIPPILRSTQVGKSYFVEVEQCGTKAIVHSFSLHIRPGPDYIPCVGRFLPEDCYSLIITIIDDKREDPSIAEANGGLTLPLLLSTLILLGLIGYGINKGIPWAIEENGLDVGTDDTFIGGFIFEV